MRRCPLDPSSWIFLLALLFAVPARSADTRGWLGIYHEPVAELPPIEEQAGGTAALLGARSGLRVTAVFPYSPAESGGLLVGDILIGALGKPFDCPAESVRAVFQRWLTPLQAGESCPLRVLRDGVDRQLVRDGEPAGEADRRLFWKKPEAYLDSLRSGETVAARAEKRQRIVDLPVVLGPRPEARWEPGPPDEEIYPPERYPEDSFGPLARALTAEYGVAGDMRDLLDRLARCHETVDPHRLRCMTYVHRQPFRLESFARDLSTKCLAARSPEALLTLFRGLLVPGVDPRRSRASSPGLPAVWSRTASDVSPATSSRTGHAIPPAARRGTAVHRSQAERERMIQPLIDQVTGVLRDLTAAHRRAFASLTEEERKFLLDHRYDLSDAFAGEIYIHFDEDRDRFGRNRRLLEIAEKVDYDALFDAAEGLARLTDPEWARAAAGLVREAFADTLEAEILLNRPTPFGRILLGGTARHWYRDLDTAFLLDLGGDDLYTGNAGGSNGWEAPLSVCIDLEGDDAYESTLKSCQGTGCFGVGAVLDLQGDDSYIGIQWCQGTGYFGIGWLRDLEGRDTYRGRTFCQGVGLFGAGFILDETGDDRYEGDCQVQGVGLAHGIGMVLDRSGDDAFYAKGLYPTGYGDAGIFDAWSQGCGIGFRTLSSGGLGLLLDGGGRDRMEAGNFSQGGGYYYGCGILRAAGDEDDIYIGSRYNQGFSAHQAVGAFLEDGGDDFYTTRQAVAQGLAWDECVTLFIDEKGNDTYQGGTGFSQGASAHNSVCMFLDRGGRDLYDYAPGQARAGGNDYHGGTSLSLFVDEGGVGPPHLGTGGDTYTCAESGNNCFRVRPEHGFFLDLPGTLVRALEQKEWRRLKRIR